MQYNNDNVHYQQSAEMMNALINANKQFDTYTYHNRNHTIFCGTTREVLSTIMLHLKETLV